MADHFYAVIMAGGGGTRLWPLSRANSPKQLLQIFSGRSLFQIAVDRLSGQFSPNYIFVVTVADQVEKLREQKPEIPSANFLIEPMPRGTAAVVAMASAALQKFDSQAVLAVLTADHLIEDIPGFQNALGAAYRVADTGYIVTLGIKPNHPATGYGYLESGEKIGLFNGIEAFRVNKFIEKPDELTAKDLYTRANMNWNSGMFTFHSDVMLKEIWHYMPDLAERIELLVPFLGIDHTGSSFVEEWSRINPQTIDYGIMEKSALAAVLPVEIGWRDVGSWDSLFEAFTPDNNGNIVLTARHIGFETTGSLVVTDEPETLVITLGMKDVIVVKTSNAILICPRGNSQRIKEIVNYLKENHYTLFL